MVMNNRDRITKLEYDMDVLSDKVDERFNRLEDLLNSILMDPEDEVVEPEPERDPRLFYSQSGALISDPEVDSHEAYIARTYGRDDGTAAMEARKAGLPSGYIRDPFGMVRKDLGGGRWGEIVKLDPEGNEVPKEGGVVSPNMVKFDDPGSFTRAQAIAERHKDD